MRAPVIFLLYAALMTFGVYKYYSGSLELEREKNAPLHDIIELKDDKIDRLNTQLIELRIGKLCVWAKPICLTSKDDLTVDTMRQILIHNEVGESLGVFSPEDCGG